MMLGTGWHRGSGGKWGYGRVCYCYRNITRRPSACLFCEISAGGGYIYKIKKFKQNSATTELGKKKQSMVKTIDVRESKLYIYINYD